MDLCLVFTLTHTNSGKVSSEKRESGLKMCLFTSYTYIQGVFFPPIGGFPPFSRDFLTPPEIRTNLERKQTNIMPFISNQNFGKMAKNSQFQPRKFTGRIHPD